jgi:hypothetical protein
MTDLETPDDDETPPVARPRRRRADRSVGPIPVDVQSLPTWLKAAVYLGVPSVIALFLVYVLTTQMSERVQTNRTHAGVAATNDGGDQQGTDRTPGRRRRDARPLRRGAPSRDGDVASDVCRRRRDRRPTGELSPGTGGAMTIEVVRERPPRIGRCRHASCHARIEWVRTVAHDRMMPVTHPLTVEREFAREHGPTITVIDAGQSHFATCPASADCRTRDRGRRR